MNEIGPLEPCCRDCLLPLKTTITSSRKESERVKKYFVSVGYFGHSFYTLLKKEITLQ